MGYHSGTGQVIMAKCQLSYALGTGKVDSATPSAPGDSDSNMRDPHK